MIRLKFPARPRRRDRTRAKWSGSVESLEGRALMAAFQWISPTNGDFGDPTMWVGPAGVHAVPGAGDDASTPAGRYTITASKSEQVGSYNGGGSLAVTGGTFSLGGAQDPMTSILSNLTIASNATLQAGSGTTLVGSLAVAGSLVAGQGTRVTLANAPGSANINTGGSLTGAGVFEVVFSVNLNTAITVPNLEVIGTITGPGPLTVTGNILINGGTLSIGRLNVPTGASLTLDGSGTATFDAGLFVDAGATTLSRSESFRLTGGARFSSYGRFSIQGDTSGSSWVLDLGGSASSFANYGTLVKTGTTGTTAISNGTFYNQSGATVEADTGQLLLDVNGVSAGKFRTMSGAGLSFASVWGLYAGTSFEGQGVVGVGSGAQGFGSIVVHTTVSVPRFALPGGYVNLADSSYLIAGDTNWTGGRIQGAGVFAVPQGGTMQIAGTSDKSLDAAGIAIAGNVTWSGGNIYLSGGAPVVIYQGGTLLATTDNALPAAADSSTIYVQGTFTKTSTTGGATTTGANVRIEPGGVLNLSSGNMATGSLFNQGTINLGSKTLLYLSGFYLQDNVGTLNLAIGGAPGTGEFGQLTASGTAGLNGTLGIYLVNNFAPTAGQVIPFVTYGSVNGDFTTKVLPRSGTMARFTIAQRANEYDATATGG